MNYNDKIKDDYITGVISREQAIRLITDLGYAGVTAATITRGWDIELMNTQVIIEFPEPDDNSTVYSSHWETESDNEPLFQLPPPKTWLVFLILVLLAIWYVHVTVT